MRQNGVGVPKPQTLLDIHSNDLLIKSLRERIAVLESESSRLAEEAANKNKSLSFLDDEQIKVAAIERKCIREWPGDGIIKGLKLRFALGKHGYNHLQATGYPTPSYSTLNRRIQHLKLDFGILEQLVNLLKTKVGNMSIADRNCCILVDEMEIESNLDFDVSTKSFVGHVTLGNRDVPGSHYTVAMIRGIKSKWKQIIAHEVTGPSTSGVEMKKFMCDVIEAARLAGLKVRASVSDMGSNNQAMWREFDVHVTKIKRSHAYKVGHIDETIYCLPDIPHVLKNLRRAFLSRIITLPKDIAEKEDLPSCLVSSGYIKQLWIVEIDATTSLRSLHHLRKDHLFPSHFSSMNVAAAVQLFSIKTAAALEKAVVLKQLPKDALTTSWWIRLVHQWFELMSARHAKVGITKANADTKISFLENIISIFQETKFGKGWKPIQTGVIMSTLSVISLTKELLASGEFIHFLPGRLTQDTLENVFSQVRRKSATKPTALAAKRAVKLICVAQFISDVKSNYANDDDMHLLDVRNLPARNSSILPNEDADVSYMDVYDLDASDMLDSEVLTNSDADEPEVLHPISASEENDIYYIAGATLNAVLKHKLCVDCNHAAQNAIDAAEPKVPEHRQILTNFCNMGGLKDVPSGIYRVCREAERKLQHNKANLLKGLLSLDTEFVNDVKKKCVNVEFPMCCRLLEKCILYYLTVRCKSMVNHGKQKGKYQTSFASASLSKKQKTK